jgi:RimJ/RimL family protein N-acetyltransferase
VRGVGIDIHASFLDVAHRRADELGVTEQVRFAVGDAGAHDIDGTFDVVSCIGATWVGGGLAGALELMKHPRVRRGGRASASGRDRTRRAYLTDERGSVEPDGGSDQTGCSEVARRATYVMSFGHWMEVVDGGVRLRLGPIRREDAHRFVAPEANLGLQSYEVGRYLGLASVPTEQDEEAWWDGASKSDDRIHWGVYVPEDDEAWKLVGNTTLHVSRRGREAQSGFLLFDRAHWRQRIASTAHLARTMYAFLELDLLAIISAADVPNIGSNRALLGVGYVQTGVRYGNGVVGGKPIDTNQYLLVNPADEAWRFFWRRPDDEIPTAFHDARTRTQSALGRAADAVRFL